MQWKSVVGYEGYYEVSNTGLVRSLDRTVPDKKLGDRYLKGKMMKLSEHRNPNRTGSGYFVVNLRRNGTSYVVPVHRLVAEAFLSNESNFPTVNHKDGNKHNNTVENLEWASYSKNNIHALVNHLREPRGNTIVQMSKENEILAIFKSACEASRVTGIGRSMISHCLNNRATYAGGYRWFKVEQCNDYLSFESTADDELLSEAQERLLTENIVCSNGNI